MRVVVTGAAGFIGRRVVAELARRPGKEIVAVDLTPNAFSELANVTYIAGNIAAAEVRAQMLESDCDVLIHLATVPGGAAEANPALAKEINLDASIVLSDEAARTTKPKIVFASSIAVFGETSAPINHETPVAPILVYGAQKAMMEIWLATKARRGEIDAISLRLPGIVARPRAPSGMKSAFMSEIFHAALNGETFAAPVSDKASLWLMSCDIAVRNILHAVDIELQDGEPHVITLPAIQCAMGELAQAIDLHQDNREGAVTYESDEALEHGFGRLPPLDASAAATLGFVNDGDLSSLVATVFSNITREENLS